MFELAGPGFLAFWVVFVCNDYLAGRVIHLFVSIENHVDRNKLSASLFFKLTLFRVSNTIVSLELIVPWTQKLETKCVALQATARVVLTPP